MALERLRELGAKAEDLTDLVRGMQVALMSSLMYLLDDPGDVAREAEVAWALLEISPSNEVVAVISSLHESVLQTDPTGREMRPRSDG